MDHVANILSSNEQMDIIQARLNIKIINIRRDRTGSIILNLAQDVKTKKRITQINNSKNLCCPRVIVTSLTYHTDNILDRPISDVEKKLTRQGRRLQGDFSLSSAKEHTCCYLSALLL